jgi:hypothetical protein
MHSKTFLAVMRSSNALRRYSQVNDRGSRYALDNRFGCSGLFQGSSGKKQLRPRPRKTNSQCPTELAAGTGDQDLLSFEFGHVRFLANASRNAGDSTVDACPCRRTGFHPRVKPEGVLRRDML